MNILKKSPLVFWLKNKVRKKNPSKKSLKFYSDLISIRDKIVFDVGANIGLRTFIFLELGGCVVAVDPNTDICLDLKKRFGKSIIVENVGVGSSNGILKLFLGSSSTISTFNENHLEIVKSGIFNEYSFNRQQLCQITTIDSLIEKYGVPVLLKIDVEGFEAEVLKGLSTPIKLIQFEFMFNYSLGWEYFVLCMNEIERLSSSYKINITMAETYNFLLEKFVDLDEFMRIMTSEYKCKKIWGDVICILE